MSTRSLLSVFASLALLLGASGCGASQAPASSEEGGDEWPHPVPNLDTHAGDDDDDDGAGDDDDDDGAGDDDDDDGAGDDDDDDGAGDDDDDGAGDDDDDDDDGEAPLLPDCDAFGVRITNDGVSSGRVWFNGVLLAGPSDFPTSDAILAETGALSGVNVVDARLTGAAGGAVRVQVLDGEGNPWFDETVVRTSGSPTEASLPFDVECD